MKYEVLGKVMQSLTVDLSPGDELFSEAGYFLFMTDNVNMDTTVLGAGIKNLFGRLWTDNSIILNSFSVKSGVGTVGLSTSMPGQIVPLDIVPGMSFIVQKRIFICAERSVTLMPRADFTMKGIFGGNGPILNKLTGNGKAFISVDGEVLSNNLERGEKILVHPHHLAAYQDSIRARMVPIRGLKNAIFGRDGLLLVELTGPGIVHLHSAGIADVIMQFEERLHGDK